MGIFMSLPSFLNERIKSQFFFFLLKITVLPFVQSLTTQNQVFTLIRDLMAAHNAWFTSPYSNADFSATQMLNSAVSGHTTCPLHVYQWFSFNHLYNKFQLHVNIASKSHQIISDFYFFFVQHKVYQSG
jgi:hypothetical protein